jgi:hypothetical protein
MPEPKEETAVEALANLLPFPVAFPPGKVIF